MANRSSIEWTDVTWNPVRGCTKISPGCKNCYASAFAERFRGVVGHPYERGFDLRIVEGKLLEPFGWTTPSNVFVNSMSDLFHSDVPEEFLTAVVEVMVAAPWHTFQVLTKRADRLSSLLNGRLKFASQYQHIWWGVSVEDIQYGWPRVEHLLRSGVSIKFLSVEPLLEDLGPVDFQGLDWVIVGGESGRGARPMKTDWVLNVMKGCEAARVPFFFKQWGGRNKKAAGRLLNGRTYDAMPGINRAPLPGRSLRLEQSLSIAKKLNVEGALFAIKV